MSWFRRYCTVLCSVLLGMAVVSGCNPCKQNCKHSGKLFEACGERFESEAYIAFACFDDPMAIVQPDGTVDYNNEAGGHHTCETADEVVSSCYALLEAKADVWSTEDYKDAQNKCAEEPTGKFEVALDEMDCQTAIDCWNGDIDAELCFGEATAFSLQEPCGIPSLRKRMLSPRSRRGR